MEKLEELLPDLENYLRNVLAKEKLSALAEKRRKYYIERLDIIKLKAPNLPPRPDGLVKFQSDSNNTSPLIRPKNEINGHVSGDIIKATTAATNHVTVDRTSVVSQENIYADMDEDEPVPNPSDGMYMVPEDASRTGSLRSNTQKSWSDSDSGTSYESYGDDDPESSTYMNVDNNFQSVDDVPLPKIAKKKRKKVNKQVEELPIGTLPNVTFKGNLYHKGSWSWPKRFCVISDNRMLVYKTEKDTRPLLNFVLLGYDVVYIDKEGRRNHVIQISHQGCETHFFAADLKEIAEMWISHLDPSCPVETPSSGDSANLSSDVMKTSQNSTSAGNVSAASSEGGSGDGVVTQQNTQPKSPKTGDDKKPASTEKKKKNILSDILGTFGKKRGQKMTKRSIDIGDLPTDPEAVMSGVLDIYHETITKNEWSPKYCVVKHGRLECFHDNVSEGIELSLTLAGADIQSAGKETKKELSIKLVWENGQKIILDVLEQCDTIEQGKWLHALIKERVGLREETDSDLLYENQDFAAPVTEEENFDDIYDEVDDRMIADRNSKSSSLDNRIFRDVNRDQSPTVNRSLSSASDSTQPPPLPSTDPPKRPLPKKRRSQEVEPDVEYENYEEKNGTDLSQAMASAFPSIKTHLEKTSSVKSSGSPKGSPMSSFRPISNTKVHMVQRTPSTTSNKSEDDGVIKCHLGPTIAEDKELLESTQNPILSELRKDKRSGSQDCDSLITQIEEIKRKLITLKKQKSDLRNKLLTCRVGREKQRLEAQLHDLDILIEESEKTVTKLQLLVQNKGGASNWSPTSSTNSSRSNSFRKEPAKPSSLSNSPRRPDTKAPPPPGTGTAKQNGKISPTAKTGPGSVKTVGSNLSVKQNPSVRSTGSASGTTAAAGMSRSWSRSASTSSTTTKQAVSKWNGTDSSTGTGTSVQKKTVVTSTKSSSEPLKVGQTRIRTVRTSTTIRSVPGQGQHQVQKSGAGSVKDGTREAKNGQNGNGKEPRKVVTERLKVASASRR